MLNDRRHGFLAVGHTELQIYQKNFSILHTSTKYLVILSLLQSYSFYTYFAASSESPLMMSR
jgi:hypothetical protein